MTVRELIEQLAQTDPDAEVWLDSGHHIARVRSIAGSAGWRDTGPIVWLRART